MSTPGFTPTGDCFTTALRFAASANHHPDMNSIYICHGIPIGGGGVVEGKRYWHAWVEFRQNRIWMAATEDANRNIVIIERDKFYEAGHLGPDDMVRYPAEEATAYAVRFNSVGPWTDQPRIAKLEERAEI